MGLMDFRVLGTLSAGDARANPRGQRARDVLALLVIRRGRPVSPEVILDTVWEEEATRLDTSVVHTVIARLRRSLGADSITRQDAGYQLATGAQVDADEFTRLVTSARSLVPEHQHRLVDLLRSALALWSGPEAFGGVSEALVATERPRLHELRDGAAEQLAERLLCGDDPAGVADAVTLMSELTGREPLREHAHELLMEGLYRSGRQAEALGVFEHLRRALRDELGIDPNPDVIAMHARILAQDNDFHQRATRRPIARRGSAPLPTTSIIGRDDELRQIAQLLDAGRRLVTIVGPGGVGKSRLLMEYARSLPGQTNLVYAELPCVSGATLADVCETLARAAGITLAAAAPLDTLAAGLRASDILLLLDEAEWSLTACSVVVDRVLSRCPGVRVVVTSRMPLDLTGESLLALGPLPAPPAGAALDVLMSAPAVRLFVDRLTDHSPGLTLSGEDYHRAAEITRRVDGLPLALEIVAGQSVSSSVADLLGLVEAPLDLEAAERDRDQRQRSLRETLTWSLDRLPGQARTMVRRLGIFDGPFDMAAALAVVGHVQTPAGTADVRSSIRTLIREAQVQVDRRDGALRMRLLRTVQALMREHLEDAGELAATAARHREWYAARWRGQPLSDSMIADIAASYPDYLGALRSALDTGDPHTLGDLAIVLSRYWFFAETGREGVAYVRRALASGALTDRQIAILRLLEVALLPQDQGTAQRATLDALAADLDDEPDWLGRLHILRSVGPYVRGDFSRALACAEEAVAVSRERAEHHLPEALGAYAVMLAAAGRTDEALAAGQEAWRLIAANPSAVDLTQVVPKVALALIDSDHPAEALTILDRTLARVERELGLAPASLFTTNAGWAALGSDRPALGLRRFAQSLAHLAGGGNLLVTGEVLAGAGAAMATMGCAGAREVLTVADDHLQSAGAVLSPWQQAIVRDRRALLPEPDIAMILTTSGFERAAALSRQAADQRPVA